MILFKCKVCIEKDVRISELKEQVEYLKQFTIPNNDPNNIPLIAREADAAISGNTETILVSVEQKDEYEKYIEEKSDEIFERDSILSGTYT